VLRRWAAIPRLPASNLQPKQLQAEGLAGGAAEWENVEEFEGLMLGCLSSVGSILVDRQSPSPRAQPGKGRGLERAYVDRFWAIWMSLSHQQVALTRDHPQPMVSVGWLAGSAPSGLAQILSGANSLRGRPTARDPVFQSRCHLFACGTKATGQGEIGPAMPSSCAALS